MPQSAPSNDPLRPPPPRRVGWLVAVLLIVALAVLGLANRERLQQWTQAWMGHTAAVPTASSAPAKISSAPAAPSSAPQPAASVAPVASAPLQLPASTASLPALHHSDATVLQELGALLGKPGLAWLVPRHLILHFVATVDNLTRQTVPLQVWPVHPVPGALRTTGQGADLAIAPDNARRYAPYVQMLTAISPQRAAQLYVQLYPLCEQAWRELGHPKSAFNDRLLAVIASLLQAPEPQGAVLLRQPKVLYTYADPALEAAPAGQKILMRMGLENERAVKDWLRQFRQDLRAQMQPAATAPSPAR
ncbi:MAG TPA: DUF3014 domain-containing protein [Thiomonas arsenitoxydans]|uniref:DUF3014 domain-containing protein n=1 Tax=Thiomonas sp. TaxID=2047785 RepID=UPI000BD0295A|nr:DUF3014 domain-containing protein [Thiomonas sp.]OZB70249.1 MAG: hypothetical protein B7X36_13445 [Thiomonas sp. 14-64-326]HOI67005.1 DUF3014 domain-containing protein [Thiomonas arsenitoxydans]